MTDTQYVVFDPYGTPTPVEVMQVAENPMAMKPGLIARFLRGTGAYGYGPEWSIGYGMPNGEDIFVSPGQWLTRTPDGEVDVLDFEPAKIVDTEPGVWMEGQGIVRSLNPDRPPFMRPYYYNGVNEWPGPWIEVEDNG